MIRVTSSIVFVVLILVYFLLILLSSSSKDIDALETLSNRYGGRRRRVLVDFVCTVVVITTVVQRRRGGKILIVAVVIVVIVATLVFVAREHIYIVGRADVCNDYRNVVRAFIFDCPFIIAQFYNLFRCSVAIRIEFFANANDFLVRNKLKDAVRGDDDTFRFPIVEIVVRQLRFRGDTQFFGDGIAERSRKRATWKFVTA
mmetsp:Transcript_6306/g.21088  ORF Transcript_6306/g.21088 Transcript_6306/m.21088 type:complete len:201 (+) Transcript_6306:2327-2929(+)